MPAEPAILVEVRRAAGQKILVLPHAQRQMSRPDRMIAPEDVRRVAETGELVEDYPEDVRGHSCLLLGRDRDNRSIHVVCSPKDECLAIMPNPSEWEADLKTRRRS